MKLLLEESFGNLSFGALRRREGLSRRGGSVDEQMIARCGMPRTVMAKITNRAVSSYSLSNVLKFSGWWVVYQ